MQLYFVGLKIKGRCTVVIGGGQIAERKVAALLDAGASVTVISKNFSPGLLGMAARTEIQLLHREYLKGDLNQAFLAVAATDSREVNETVAEEARESRVLINVVDEPDLCDFYVPAVVKRGDLQIAITSGGASPLLSKSIRIDLERQYGPAYDKLVEMLGQLRIQLKTSVSDRENRYRAERDFLKSEALEFIKKGDIAKAEGIKEQCILKYMV